MDSFEFNKLAGGVLFSLLLLFGLSVVSDLIFASHSPEPPGYEVAVEDGDGGDGGKVGDGDGDKPTLAQLLAAGDAGRGEKQFKKCKSCHTSEKGGAAKIGPPMWDIVGRTVAAVGGFSYSAALKEKGGEWSYEFLDCFLLNPKKCVPGTKMAYAGLKKDGQRADMIVYLRSLSDEPKPLPEVETAAKDGDGADAEKAPAPAPADGENAGAEKAPPAAPPTGDGAETDKAPPAAPAN